MANRLDTYALLTVDEGRDALDLGDNHDQDDSVILYINGITELIERYCGREFLTRTYTTETFDGDGTNRYLVKDGTGITSVTTVVYNEDGDTVPAGSILYNPVGEIYLDDGYSFESGFQNCSVTYVAGEAAVPPSIKIAALIILASWWKMRDKHTERIFTMSREGQVISYKMGSEDMPPEAQRILDDWQRPRVG